VAEKNLEGSWG